jgi:hypothetical protein
MASKKISSTFAVILVVGVFMLYFFFNPSEHAFFPNCPFETISGYKCPACGSQRAIHQLLHGNIGGAFKLNPLLVLSIPLAIYGIGIKYWNYMFLTNYRFKLLSNTFFIVGYVLTVLLFWVFRNVPEATINC